MAISGRRARTPARLVVGVAIALVLVVAVLVGWAVLHEPPARGTPTSTPHAVIAPEAGSVSVTRAVSSLAILRDWDRSRAAAWRDGDTRSLRGLYVPASTAGASDVAMLQRWRARGLRVAGMQMQVLAVELRARTDRELVLVVTDRLVGAEAVPSSIARTGAGSASAGSTSGGVALPRDQPTTRRIVFQRLHGRWLVASAAEVAQPSPVVSTAPTSGSSN